jgi:hypothetical protein
MSQQIVDYIIMFTFGFLAGVVVACLVVLAMSWDLKMYEASKAKREADSKAMANGGIGPTDGGFVDQWWEQEGS